jgi:3-deoxy-D-manno-octulosonate 8-phosphate phosphatase (KDO 8-P phosphatase)
MNFLDKLNNIQNFVFDIDGVFTDGSVLVQDDGSLLRIMNTKDGLALKHAAA